MTVDFARIKKKKKMQEMDPSGAQCELSPVGLTHYITGCYLLH